MLSLAGIFTRLAAPLAALLLTAFGVGHSQSPEKTFLPLAAAVITTSGDQLGVLLEEVRAFADQRRIEIKNFPKPNQQTINFTIPLGLGSFFYVHNFQSKQKINIIAYSTGKPEDWIPDWNHLIGQLTKRLGKDHVAVTQAPL